MGIKKIKNDDIYKSFNSIRCSICGETEVTLYKNGDKYICKDCKILEDLYNDEEEEE